MPRARVRGTTRGCGPARRAAVRPRRPAGPASRVPTGSRRTRRRLSTACLFPRRPPRGGRCLSSPRYPRWSDCAAAAGAPALDRRIADLRHELSILAAEQRAHERQHRADVLRAMKDLLTRHGFKPSELGAVRSGKATAGRSPAAPLYRDPATGATRSGRGIEPAWIKGHDREAFKVTG